MKDFPCVVIRRICDYYDSHRTRQRQGYDAISAAVYARSLLLAVPQLQSSIPMVKQMSHR
ncbi:g-protein beta wd-40 repeats containing [Colletotrichum truncatum]|uniref:G-protein beta wd-40 repeats containing n=1 Tax=Colletotrichum truncatum TaxID=5467 RepID=A0ACC3Z2R4_COLTU|nr:WD domain-containing protein [Colletotrichum truncatum]KAF6780846.1 WD domain-containing protein [Colletotrichum truncatum]